MNKREKSGIIFILIAMFFGFFDQDINQLIIGKILYYDIPVSMIIAAICMIVGIILFVRD